MEKFTTEQRKKITEFCFVFNQSMKFCEITKYGDNILLI